MTSVDEYRAKAAEFLAMARHQTNPAVRANLESLASSYLHLAEQAERNSLTDMVYETPPMLDQQKQQPTQQESQQQQSKSGPQE